MKTLVHMYYKDFGKDIEYVDTQNITFNFY